MFLNRLKQNNDRGAALVAVVALVAITAVVGVSVTAAVLSANGISTTTRAGVQSRGSADAGIDAAYARLAAGSYVCSVTSSVDPVFTATLSYHDAGGSPLSCAGSVVTGVPATVVIRSVGQSQSLSVQTGDEEVRTVVAEVDVTAAGNASGDLENAVFSESGFTLTNNTQLIGTTSDANDANTYSNGTIICSTQVAVQGTMYAEGDISLQNSCTTAGTVWAGGKVTFSSQARSKGDVYAAGTGVLAVGSGHVDGSVIANGSITLDTNSGKLACPGTSVAWSICGSAVSLGGTVGTTNSANVAGSVYAKSGVSFAGFNGEKASGADVLSISGNLSNGNNSNQAGKIAGTARVGGSIYNSASVVGDKANSCQGVASSDWKACGVALTIPAPRPAVSLPAALGYPVTTVVNPPPRQQMPQINSAASDIADWTTAGWTPVIFDATTAAAAGKTSCQQAVDYVATSPVGKHLVVVRDCASPVYWNNATITLAGDVAMMSTSGFSTDNVLTVKSSTSAQHAFMFIVPADSSNVTWSPVPGITPTQYSPSCSGSSGKIAIQNTTVQNVAWFLYTPCALTFQNQLSGFKGQLYGGSVNYPNNSTIQLVKFSIPGISSDGTAADDVAAGTATIRARYDVTG
ncbi:hypothetical protein BH09ACT3_BH09ACT3_06740 [soil metagenome]